MANDKVPGRRRLNAQDSVGKHLGVLDDNLDKLDELGFEFRGFNAKAPSARSSDWMVTIKATVNGEHVVGFISAFSLAEALVKMVEGFRTQSIKWKVDEYAK